MSRIRPPLTTSMTGPSTTPSVFLDLLDVPQARSYWARFLDRISRPSLSSFWRTRASISSPMATTSCGSTSLRIDSSRLGITPFGLVADVEQHLVLVDLDDGAGDDVARRRTRRWCRRWRRRTTCRRGRRSRPASADTHRRHRCRRTGCRPRRARRQTRAGPRRAAAGAAAGAGVAAGAGAAGATSSLSVEAGAPGVLLSGVATSGAGAVLGPSCSNIGCLLLAGH